MCDKWEETAFLSLHIPYISHEHKKNWSQTREPSIYYTTH